MYRQTIYNQNNSQTNTWHCTFLTEKSTPQNCLADLKSSKRYIKRSKTKSKLRVIKILGSVKKIGIGKKNWGCKKNSHVKKFPIPRPRFPQQICLQIMISCVYALIVLIGSKLGRGTGFFGSRHLENINPIPFWDMIIYCTGIIMKLIYRREA